jgi:hypothetical protein
MDPNQTRLTAAQKRRGFVSPEDATPDTPRWRIVRTDKSARFPCGDLSRTVCYGRCTAFESVSESCVYAEFAVGNLRIQRLEKIDIAGELKYLTMTTHETVSGYVQMLGDARRFMPLDEEKQHVG